MPEINSAYDYFFSVDDYFFSVDDYLFSVGVPAPSLAVKKKMASTSSRLPQHQDSAYDYLFSVDDYLFSVEVPAPWLAVSVEPSLGKKKMASTSSRLPQHQDSPFDYFFCCDVPAPSLAVPVEPSLGKKKMSTSSRLPQHQDSPVDYFFCGDVPAPSLAVPVEPSLGKKKMASSSSRRRRWKYDVFLSFRGADTRWGITTNLFGRLERRGIKTFMDDQDLQVGDVISPSLLAAIEESRFAIVVLSPNYASSSWCLDELVKIIQCMKEMGLRVMPLFYNVDPSDVRHQRGSFELKRKPQVDVEVREHEEVYGKNEDKLKAWRSALTEVANLSGWHTQNYRTERDLLDKIVDTIGEKVVYKSSSVDKGFVGMDFRVDDLLHNYIHQELDEVRIIGIHGMQGVGKTTVARAFYDDFCRDFKHRCFLFNVRERFKRDGLVSLQKNLLSSILMDKIEYIEDEYTGAAMIERSLCKTKVLVVLDDVDQLAQLENLAGSRDWFGPGSRIIITTTDNHLLKAHGVDATYNATGLSSDEALELLSLKAFKKSSPPENYSDLCDHILGYAEGLPLALVVIGSFLCGKSTNEWASAIDRLKNTLDRRIIDVLQISFDGVEDTERNFFDK